jgi:hypothetical protein
MSSADKQQIVDRILVEFMEIFENMRIYHWRTAYYGRHKASCKFVESWTGLTDSFVENMIGHFPEVKDMLASKSFAVTIRVYKENQTIKADEMWQKLQTLADKLQALDTVFEGVSDLLNIRDEIVGQIKSTQYLFSFK